jgi:hypothetical protein
MMVAANCVKKIERGADWRMVAYIPIALCSQIKTGL